MKLRFYSQTLKGDQVINQDAMSHCICDDRAFFVVADGLGGHLGGELISRAFCDNLLLTYSEFKNDSFSLPAETMVNWIEKASELMKKQLDQSGFSYQAHSTCAILWIDPQQVITAHIGDSRIYRFNSNKKIWRTRDHSVTQMLVDEGDITENEMGAHPDQNRLTRSICTFEPSFPTIKIYSRFDENDTFLLCTDGFWTNSKEHELVALADSKTTEQNIIEQANLAIKRAKGNSDNVTWQWIRNSF